MRMGAFPGQPIRTETHWETHWQTHWQIAAAGSIRISRVPRTRRSREQRQWEWAGRSPTSTHRCVHRRIRLPLVLRSVQVGWWASTLVSDVSDISFPRLPSRFRVTRQLCLFHTTGSHKRYFSLKCHFPAVGSCVGACRSPTPTSMFPLEMCYI